MDDIDDMLSPEEELAAQVPDDYEDEQDFLRDMREDFRDGVSVDDENRRAAREDFEFLAGDQWPEAVSKRRQQANKPVLTINKLPAMVAQVVGHRRMGETSIKVHPDKSENKPIARIRQGLIRFIEKRSADEVAYRRAYFNAVAGGEGNFRLEIDYVNGDVFEQEIKIGQIPNPFSVIWDPNSIDPTGRDARYCFVVDNIPKKKFEKLFPNVVPSDFTNAEGITGEVRGDGWFEKNNVRVVSYWRMRKENRFLALMQDGRVLDVTERPPQEWMQGVAINPETGRPIMREAPRMFAELTICTGTHILEGPFKYWIDRVPVFRVMGWETFIGDRRERWGMIRFLKDPQRMFNYWRSVIAEKMTKTPKNTWLAADNAVQGREKAFRNAANSDDPLLIFNSDAGAPPMLQQPVQMEPALLNEAGMAGQDMRDVSNLHEAAMGQQSNEVSGVALQARMRIVEMSATVYQENMDLAIQECGRVINDLIPYIYDTPRQVRILGEDDAEEIVEINQPGGIDIGVGKYDITITTGPSYATKRIEAAESMMAAVNAMPDLMGVAMDKIVEAQDWPGADEIARRLQMRLDPGSLPQEELTPQQQQQLQSQQQQQQVAQQLQMALQQADLAMKQAQAQDFQARAQDAQARAMKSLASIDLEQLKMFMKQDETQKRLVIDAMRVMNDLMEGDSGERQ